MDIPIRLRCTTLKINNLGTLLLLLLLIKHPAVESTGFTEELIKFQSIDSYNCTFTHYLKSDYSMVIILEFYKIN
ncbi:hypothetical protein WN943_001854 [Citrus x changshan-huyou]